MNPDNNQDSNNAPLQDDNKQGNPRVDPTDNLTPDHPRFKEVIAEKNELKQNVTRLESEMNDLRNSINQRQNRDNDDSLTYDEQQALDRIERGLKDRGWVNREDLRAQRRADDYDRLEKEYDGKNGLPKFIPTDVEVYAKKNGFGDNLLAAYRELHFEAIVQQEAKKASDKPEVPTSEKPSSGERGNVADTEFSPEAISAMSDEEYERNRDKILGSIRTQSRQS